MNNLDAIFAPSDDIVARDIAGELIIVPIAAGIGDTEDEIYTLNRTGRVIWDHLDGRRRLRDVVQELALKFQAEPGVIEKDVLGLVAELAERRMLIEVNTPEPA